MARRTKPQPRSHDCGTEPGRAPCASRISCQTRKLRWNPTAKPRARSFHLGAVQEVTRLLCFALVAHPCPGARSSDLRRAPNFRAIPEVPGRERCPARASGGRRSSLRRVVEQASRFQRHLEVQVPRDAPSGLPASLAGSPAAATVERHSAPMSRVATSEDTAS